MPGNWSVVVKAAVAPLSSLFGNGAPPRSRVHGGWVREPFAGAWQRGISGPDSIGELTAFSAVYASLSLISGDIAKLEPRLMRRRVDGTWVPVQDDAPEWAPLREPNAFQTRNQFLRGWMLSKLMHGNVYVLKVRNDRGQVRRLHLLDPRRVTPMVTPEGDVYYSLGGDDLARIPTGQVVPASEILHDRAATLWHPLIGVPPLHAAAASATHGRRIQSNSIAFFENMSQPGGFLTAPGVIDDVTADRMKREFETNYSGANVGRLAVLGDGLKYEATGAIPAEQAQLIDQLKWTAIDIAGAFLVPAYKLNLGPMPTANNVEALSQQYFSETLQVHLEDIESLMNRGLGLPSDWRVEFDLDGLLRMDTAAQIETLARGVGAAIFSPNEARLKRNLPPAEGGNSPMAQQQNFSLQALARRDAREDPFDGGSGGSGGGSKSLEVGMDGRDGRDGVPGEPGRDAVQIDVLEGIDPAKRYPRSTYASFRGGIVRSYRTTDPLPDDGELEKAGWHVVVRGIADDEIELGDDLRTLTFKRTFTDGVVVRKQIKVPVMIDRGIFKGDAIYHAGDVVTWGGSMWIAQRSTLPGEEPGDASGSFRLSVKKGRDGRDGLRGEKGDRGAEGRSGRDATQLGPNGGKW